MIHENGLDNAYKKVMGIDVLEDWLAAPEWGASRAFLHDHPELFHEHSREMLKQLIGDRDIERVHQALLVLAQTPEGIDQAYKSLEDVQSLQPIVRAAVADRDAIRLMACSDIEIMHGRFFARMLYTILAALLVNPSEVIPQGVLGELSVMAAGTEPTERAAALADFGAALADIPVTGPVGEQVQHILSLSSPS